MPHSKYLGFMFLLLLVIVIAAEVNMLGSKQVQRQWRITYLEFYHNKPPTALTQHQNKADLIAMLDHNQQRLWRL